MRLLPLPQQTFVITGATSGIGLTTTRAAIRGGARVVAAARSRESLAALRDEFASQADQLAVVEADVGRLEDVERIAAQAIERFDGFTTWVNNAAGSVYGTCLDVSIHDMQRVMDTNFWGVVHGSRVACRHLSERGGALINVGSVVSDRAVPLQGIYSCSKHAVKAWTDALRVELADAGAAIAVTLIKPGPIATPYAERAKNYLPDAPQHVPPVYSPDAVAAAILYCASTPVREMFVGSSATMLSWLQRLSPRLTDLLVRPVMMRGTHSGRPRGRGDALHSPGEGLRERGALGRGRPSLTAALRRHPRATGAGLALLGGLLLRARLARAR